MLVDMRGGWVVLLDAQHVEGVDVLALLLPVALRRRHPLRAPSIHPLPRDQFVDAVNLRSDTTAGGVDRTQ